MEKKEAKGLYVVWGQTINKFNEDENKKLLESIFEASDHTGQACPCKGC